MRTDSTKVEPPAPPESDPEIRRIRFRVTGRAAHARIAPLVPSDWIDVSPYCEKKKEPAPDGARASDPPSQHCGDNNNNSNEPHCHDGAHHPPPDFVWENCPRKDTRGYRDRLKCYSHLPNGKLLDSKWALARLLSSSSSSPQSHDEEEEEDGAREASTYPYHQQLETHCFRGMSGLRRIEKYLLQPTPSLVLDEGAEDGGDESDKNGVVAHSFYDLLDPDPSWSPDSQRAPRSLRWWAIKDADANGAGGVWIVGRDTMAACLNPETSPLHEDHRYVAQAYVWPPVLYGNRKCHARVYGLMTGDGRAFVHNRAFLHVANDDFTWTDRGLTPSVHITNCCANSHDASRFAGEILASLLPPDRSPETDGGEVSPNTVVSLADFAESIYGVVATLARRSRTFIQGGMANGGFEYLGLDFAFSFDVRTGQPKAYLLEVNAPPSQDTATGLPHAEALHDTVISDLLGLWVLPKVLGVPESSGGWHCVYVETDKSILRKPMTEKLPSQMALLNKMRWAMRERKAVKRLESSGLCESIAAIRDQFPYFRAKANPRAFFENAGGAQVPHQVSERVAEALKSRHRTGTGQQAKDAARKTLHTLLGASASDFDLYFGPNATTLLALLSHELVRSGFLTKGDEVLLSADNHLANLTPWLEAAEQVGATVLWCETSSLDDIAPLVSSSTRIVAVSHASNVLGQVRDVLSICQRVRDATSARAHVVVDGVAAVPHMFADLDSVQPDWYVVSCHKQFGPHIGVLCRRKASSSHWVGCRSLEVGTINYEACAGIEGLGNYFLKLAEIASGSSYSSLDLASVQSAYRLVSSLEKPLIKLLDDILGKRSSPQGDNVRVLMASKNDRFDANRRIPVVSFVHRRISSASIVQECAKNGILCRNGTFLCCSRFQQMYGLNDEEGVVRVSLAHYNTSDELKGLANVLENMPGWL